MILILIMMITLYLIFIEGVYRLLWQLYIQYISKLTLEIQILRVLANTPTGYGHAKKLFPKIKKKKLHFSDCNENLFKLQGSFCSLFCYNYMYLHNRQHNY